MADFDSLLPRLRDQLTKNVQAPGNFYGQARSAKEAIREAHAMNDLRAERAAAAAYGGVVKRWRRWLIEQITEVALAGCDTSRDRVRDWQQCVFGQAVASERLRHYATPERSGGGRSAPLPLDESIEAQALEFYKRQKDAIKKV